MYKDHDEGKIIEKINKNYKEHHHNYRVQNPSCPSLYKSILHKKLLRPKAQKSNPSKSTSWFLSLRQYLSFIISLFHLLPSNSEIQIRNDTNFRSKFIYSMSLFIKFTNLFISNEFYYKYLFTILLIFNDIFTLILCDG